MAYTFSRKSLNIALVCLFAFQNAFGAAFLATPGISSIGVSVINPDLLDEVYAEFGETREYRIDFDALPPYNPAESLKEYVEESADTILLQIIDELDKLKSGEKLSIDCIPTTFEQALIANELGFVQPRNEPELKKARYLGFTDTASHAEIAGIAQREFSSSKKSTVASVRYPHENMLHKLKLSGPVSIGSLTVNELLIVSLDNNSVNKLANAITKYNIEEFRLGLENACLLGFTMLLLDRRNVEMLSGKISSNPEEISRISNKIISVEEASERLGKIEKHYYTNQQIRELNEALMGVNLSSDYEKEKDLLNHLSALRVFRAVCTSAMGKNYALSQESLQKVQKMYNRVNDKILRTAIKLITIKLENNNYDQAEKLLNEYFTKKSQYPGLKELADKINKHRADEESLKRISQLEELKNNISGLIERGRWDEAYAQAEGAAAKYGDVFDARKKEVESTAREHIPFWVPYSKRAKLVSLAKSLKAMRKKYEGKTKTTIVKLGKGVGKSITVSAGIHEMSEAALGIVVLLHSLPNEVLTIIDKKLNRQLIETSSTDEELPVFISRLSSSHLSYKGGGFNTANLIKRKNLDELYEIIEKINIYTDILIDLYDTDDPTEGSLRLARLTGKKDVKAESTLYSDDELLNAVSEFEQEHIKASRLGDTADEAAKHIIKLLLSNKYRDFCMLLDIYGLYRGISLRINDFEPALMDDMINIGIYKAVVVASEHIRKIIEMMGNVNDLQFLYEPWRVYLLPDSAGISNEEGRKIWKVYVDHAIMTINNAVDHKNFTRVIPETGKTGRVMDTELLYLLPKLGFSPSVDVVDFMRILENDNYYESAYVLPSEASVLCELVVRLNNSFRKEVNFAGSRNNTECRFILFRGGIQETDDKEYEKLVENGRLKKGQDGKTILSGLVAQNRALLAVEHRLLDVDVFVKSLQEAAFLEGTPGEMFLYARKVMAEKQFKKIYTAKDIYQPFARDNFIAGVLEKSAIQENHENPVVALKLLQRASKRVDDLGINAALEKTRYKVDRYNKVEYAQRALNSGILTQMKKALQELEIFFTGSEKPASAVMAEKTAGYERGYIVWWALAGKIENIERINREIKTAVLKVESYIASGEFELAWDEIKKADDLGCGVDTISELSIKLSNVRVTHAKCESLRIKLNNLDKRFVKEGGILESCINMISTIEEIIITLDAETDTPSRNAVKSIAVDMLEKISRVNERLAEEVQVNGETIDKILDQVKLDAEKTHEYSDIDAYLRQMNILLFEAIKNLPSINARNEYRQKINDMRAFLLKKSRDIALKDISYIKDNLDAWKEKIEQQHSIEELDELFRHYEELENEFARIKQRFMEINVTDVLEAIKLKYNQKRSELQQKAENLRKLITERLASLKNELQGLITAELFKSQDLILEELRQFLNEIPSREIKEMMQAEIASHRSNLDGLKASKIMEDSQLKIIEGGLQSQVNGTIEAIKNWPLRGRHGLIDMGKRPADLGKNVYKLLGALDLSVPVSKQYYDKTTALLERVVNDKTEDMEIELRRESNNNAEKKKLPRPKPQKTDKVKVIVAKELSDFEKSLLEEILKLPFKVETAYLKLFRGIVECALRGDSAGEQRHQAKIVELLTKGVDMGLYSHLMNAWNNVRSGSFQDAIELYKILLDSYPEYTELNSLMIQILASKIKVDDSAEKKLVQKAENMLRSDKELNRAAKNDYMELIMWVPESPQQRKHTKPSETENPKTVRSVKKSG